ncbi:MAG TPA: hypothetical protein VGK22_14025 [Candidatus Angelobacter sp.]|jgi:hypothetical protein
MKLPSKNLDMQPSGRNWSRGDKIALAGLIIAALPFSSSEFRRWTGIDKEPKPVPGINALCGSQLVLDKEMDTKGRVKGHGTLLGHPEIKCQVHVFNTGDTDLKKIRLKISPYHPDQISLIDNEGKTSESGVLVLFDGPDVPPVTISGREDNAYFSINPNEKCKPFTVLLILSASNFKEETEALVEFTPATLCKNSISMNPTQDQEK